MSKPRSQKLATILAFAGTVTIPGLHKFYVGQRGWGVVYLLFWWTTLPSIASAIEGVWYLSQDREEFDQHFNLGLLPESSSPQTVPADPARVSAIAEALRQLDSLRQEGLISEYEFEQKRRQLLE
ncbi:MAG TPA: NINE protein [Candidatus Caenarcaniphilales bacterium]